MQWAAPGKDERPARRGHVVGQLHRLENFGEIGKATAGDLNLAVVGKGGWKDWNVARQAREGDFVLVTNNATDFRGLYATQPLHAGLVIIIPNVGRMIQRQLFLGVIEQLWSHRRADQPGA